MKERKSSTNCFRKTLSGNEAGKAQVGLNIPNGFSYFCHHEFWMDGNARLSPMNDAIERNRRSRPV